MNRNRFFVQLIVVLLSSLVGVTLGQAVLRVARAGERPSQKRPAIASKPSSRSRTSQAAIKPVAQSRGTSCPNIKAPLFSLIAQDYSSDEGLAAPRHGGLDSASVNLQISGLPDRTYVPVTLTFNLSTTQITNTIHNTVNTLLSDSISESEVDIYLAGIGTNFLIKGYTQISQDAVSSQSGTPLPNGILQYTVMVPNGTANISAIIQASAVTSFDSATASTVITLDFIDASFASNNSPALNTIPPGSATISPIIIFNQCPDDCGPRLQAIEKRVNELKCRYQKLLDDPCHLYCTYYDRLLFSANGVRIGSYSGHIQQFIDKQKNLQKLISNASRCIIPPEATLWANIPAPTQPTNPPCSMPGNGGGSPCEGDPSGDACPE